MPGSSNTGTPSGSRSTEDRNTRLARMEARMKAQNIGLDESDQRRYEAARAKLWREATGLELGRGDRKA